MLCSVNDIQIYRAREPRTVDSRILWRNGEGAPVRCRIANAALLEGCRAVYLITHASFVNPIVPVRK